MKISKKKTRVEPYDIWKDATVKPTKLHPSQKRSKKTPLPHPGQSYNPDPEEHEKFLQKILKKELEFQKKEESLKRAFDTKVSKKEVLDNEKQELVSGIKHLIKAKQKNAVSKIEDDEDDDSSGTEIAFSDYDDKDFEAIIKDKRVIEKRKSHQQRLRQMKDRLQRKEAKLKKLKKQRLSKFDSIKKINKELDKRDKGTAAKKKKHKNIKNERLGQKFEQSDPVYCLSSELPKNLREVSCPMNKIVRQQLESFQSRLLVEPTSIQARNRKYKKKVFERKIAAEQEA